LKFKYIPFLLLLTGCIYWTNDKSTNILEVPSKNVATCKLLGEVYGESNIPFLSVGYKIAKDKAKLEATKLGATHIYWHEVSTGLRQYLLGRAYLCEKSML